MKRKFIKCLFSVILCILLVSTVLPLQAFAGTNDACYTGDASALSHGDVFELGLYPQSSVTDWNTVNALNSISCEMKSYGYIKNVNGSSYETIDMSYGDVVYNGTAYRKVSINEYRPLFGSDNEGTSSNKFQYDNGYYKSNTYYFRWEPVRWTVLANEVFNNVLVMSQKLLDAPYYNKLKEATTWESSDLRYWLDNDFKNSAFSQNEQGKLKSSRNTNAASPFDSSIGGGGPTTDNIWILSVEDEISTQYGFVYNYGIDPDRIAQGTDYAKCQGLQVSGSEQTAGNSIYWLRNPGKKNTDACATYVDGSLMGSDTVNVSAIGVRPVFLLDRSITLSGADGSTCRIAHEFAESGRVEPTCTTDGYANYKCKHCEATKQESLPALGHEYGEPAWSWADDFSSAQAIFTCTRCHKHNEVVDAEVKQELRDDGNYYVVAAVEFDNKTFSDEKMISTYTVTWKNDDGTVLEADTNVSFGTTPCYDGAIPTKDDDDKYSYTFSGWSPALSPVIEDVTYTATFTKTLLNDSHFSQNGDVCTIKDALGWDIFCDLLADNDKGYFTGKTVQLGDDMEVTRMAGGTDHDFTGTFDGQGHTLTVSYGTSDIPIDEDKVSPFRNADNGCVIKNLHTVGTIYTSKQFASGIISTLFGEVTIENCHCSAVIVSSCGGDGTHGGLVGYVGNTGGAGLTIDGCVFDGKILSVGETATTNCSGFVGYNGNKVTITNSIYAPAALASDETEVNNDCATFVRNSSADANCYYTRALGSKENQGNQAYTITAGDGVTLDFSGEKTEYSVSGITAYANNSGLKYGETYYAGKDDTVTLTLDHDTPTGCITTYTASSGTLENGILTMPDDDVEINAVDTVGARFAGHTISLQGDIGVNFYLNLTDQEIADGAVVDFSWTVNEKEKTNTVTLTEQDKTDNGYRATCPVAVAEMTYDVTATLSINGEFDSADTYSAVQYADTILTDDDFAASYINSENNKGNNGEERLGQLRTMVKTMLDYGAKAQIAFDRNTDNLANAKLTSEDADSPYYYAPEAVTPDMIDTGASDMSLGLYDFGLEYCGSTIVYLSDTSIRHYYKVTDQDKFNAVKDSVTFDGSAVTFTKKNGSIYYELKSIHASDLNTLYTLSIDGAEYKYSALDYVKACLNSDKVSEATKALVSATYLYSRAANDYFGR